MKEQEDGARRLRNLKRIEEYIAQNKMKKNFRYEDFAPLVERRDGGFYNLKDRAELRAALGVVSYLKKRGYIEKSWDLNEHCWEWQICYNPKSVAQDKTGVTTHIPLKKTKEVKAAIEPTPIVDKSAEVMAKIAKEMMEMHLDYVSICDSGRVYKLSKVTLYEVFELMRATNSLPRPTEEPAEIKEPIVKSYDEAAEVSASEEAAF